MYVGDHAEGTKVACKVTEERRVILQSSSHSSARSSGSGGDHSSRSAAFNKARSRIYDLFNKSKIKLVAREQKLFLNNLKGTTKQLYGDEYAGYCI